jgi:hypothetical protein
VSYKIEAIRLLALKSHFQRAGGSWNTIQQGNDMEVWEGNLQAKTISMIINIKKQQKYNSIHIVNP